MEVERMAEGGGLLSDSGRGSALYRWGGVGVGFG